MEKELIVSQLSQIRGGITQKGPTHDTDYLIIGSEINSSWATESSCVDPLLGYGPSIPASLHTGKQT